MKLFSITVLLLGLYWIYRVAIREWNKPDKKQRTKPRRRDK